MIRNSSWREGNIPCEQQRSRKPVSGSGFFETQDSRRPTLPGWLAELQRMRPLTRADKLLDIPSAAHPGGSRCARGLLSFIRSPSAAIFRVKLYQARRAEQFFFFFLLIAHGWRTEILTDRPPALAEAERLPKSCLMHILWSNRWKNENGLWGVWSIHFQMVKRQRE